MAVTIHFKDGSTASLGNGQDAIPFPGDNTWIQIIGGGASHVGLVLTALVQYTENV